MPQQNGYHTHRCRGLASGVGSSTKPCRLMMGADSPHLYPTSSVGLCQPSSNMAGFLQILLVPIHVRPCYHPGFLNNPKLRRPEIATIRRSGIGKPTRLTRDTVQRPPGHHPTNPHHPVPTTNI